MYQENIKRKRMKILQKNTEAEANLMFWQVNLIQNDEFSLIKILTELIPGLH